MSVKNNTANPSIRSILYGIHTEYKSESRGFNYFILFRYNLLTAVNYLGYRVNIWDKATMFYLTIFFEFMNTMHFRKGAKEEGETQGLHQLFERNAHEVTFLSPLLWFTLCLTP